MLKGQRKRASQEYNQAQQYVVAAKESVLVRTHQQPLGPGHNTSKICSTEVHDSVIVETMNSRKGYKSEIIDSWETMDNATAADIYQKYHNMYQEKNSQGAAGHDYMKRLTTKKSCSPNDENQPQQRGQLPKFRHIEGCIVCYLKKLFTTPYLESYSTTDPELEILSAV